MKKPATVTDVHTLQESFNSNFYTLNNSIQGVSTTVTDISNCLSILERQSAMERQPILVYLNQCYTTCLQVAEPCTDERFPLHAINSANMNLPAADANYAAIDLPTLCPQFRYIPKQFHEHHHWVILTHHPHLVYAFLMCH